MNSVLPKNERQAIKKTFKLLQISPKEFALSVFLGFMAIGSAVCLTAISAWLIARASQMPLWMDLSLAAVSVRMFGIGKALFRYITNIYSHKIALYGMSTLRTHVYSALSSSSTDIVTSVARGDLLTRTGRDVDSIGDLVVRALQPAGVALSVSLLSIGIVSFYSPIIGAILAFCLLLSGIISPYIAMKGARIAEKSQIHDRAALAAHSLSILENSSELRISGRLAAMEAKMHGTEKDILKNRDDAARPHALSTALDTLAIGIITISSIFIGAYQVEQGTLAHIGLCVVVLTSLAAFEATQTMEGAMVQLVRSAAASLRITDLLSNANTEDELNTTDKKITLERQTPHKKTSLHIRDLHIGWPDSATLAGPLSLDIQGNETVAIVGPSGIGKSTLLYTLAGMLTPHKGSVLLGDKEISRLSREEVSHSLILTAEDAHIFHTSILENIRVARGDVTEDEAIELLNKAGLGQWLSELPDGIHTLIGENAATISGGERRRLLLARALASHAHFLLLDEPGEHLDNDTADQLIKDLLQAGSSENGQQRSVILVTHRLTPLAFADRIIYISQHNNITSIQAIGTHKELMKTIPEYKWAVDHEK
ncbi:MAG: thiol reductant ABC exporter subunit CydC [Actinomycetaceae bacterium]|nr:thiol reductant ABC exporter subunit CydC [Actinomycetaceae bacterium]